jgi:GNAT superfamily N-acetyltransferase
MQNSLCMNTSQINGIQNIIIERINQKEVDVAIEWAQKEGWNPGVHDAECYYHADQTGFYAAKLNGEVIGTISLVKYPGDFVFEGLYIIKPEFRGKGIGKQVQEYALDLCKDMNLGLDGVVLMKEKYEDYGFKFAYNNWRFAGKADDKSSKNCMPIMREDFKEVVAYDKECFRFDRIEFLDCWLFQKDHTSMLIRDSKGEISGYGVIRKCFNGYKIGPLFTNSEGEAELLFNSLTSTVFGETVFLDVPEPNETAVQFAQLKCMQPVFSTVRMYSKSVPDLLLNKIFGVTTFELG